LSRATSIAIIPVTIGCHNRISPKRPARTTKSRGGKHPMTHHYSITIQWSDEDQKFIAHLPEFGPYTHTHGETYNAALQNALEVLYLLIEDYTAQGKSLPRPQAISA